MNGFVSRLRLRISNAPWSLLGDIAFGLALFIYLILFYLSLQGRWFHRDWTTDDALQQAFVFHDVIHPGLFKGDLIYQMMRHYLVPGHYLIKAAVTYFTGDPIMAGHWVMLIQLILCLVFLYLYLKDHGGFAPACFGLMWFFHTRNTVQRITGGLQRGWAPGMLFAFLYFAGRERWLGAFIVLGVSCLLHPPSALAIGIAMGIIFSVRAFCGRSKQKYLRMLGIYLVLAPLFVFETYMAVKKPPELGRMVSYKEALEMPEFSRDGGRFKMVPFWKPSEEIRVFAFQAFNSSLHKAPSFFENHTVEIVVFLAVLLVIFGMVRRKPSFRLECVAFLVAIFITYFCARLFAFYLFVPQRYIQIPMTVFFVASFPLAVWSVFRGKTDQRGSLTQYMGLVFLGVIVAVGSGSGLYGDANFNKVRTQKGHLWNWVRKYTPKNALIAGHPTHIDGVMLFGERRGYATTETAHPFYDKYYAKIKKRLEISLKAHYARSLKELALILKPEGVDYFIFKRKNFYPEALKKSRYFRPLDVLVRELTSRRYTDYAYKQLPRKVDMENAPYMPYRDDQSVVVDMRKLYQWLNAQGEKSSTPSVR